MLGLIQRVSSASVSIESEAVSKIGPGLVAFVGVGGADTEEDARYLAEKIAGLRIFSDSEGKFNLDIHQVNGEVLAVSQFTLMASTRKGRRPSFTQAAPPEIAELLFQSFTQSLKDHKLPVQTGRFQTHMLVEINNDGPVTIAIDSRDRLQPRK